MAKTPEEIQAEFSDALRKTVSVYAWGELVDGEDILMRVKRIAEKQFGVECEVAFDAESSHVVNIRPHFVQDLVTITLTTVPINEH